MKQDMERLYKDEFGGLVSNGTKYSLTYIGHVLPYLAKQMVTAYHNNIKEDFITRLMRFINKMTEKYEKILLEK